MSTIGRRGALIVLEGCDKAGKTTHCRQLLETLQASGHSVELMHFPDRSTKSGALISSYLEGKENLEDRAIHLLFSVNRWELVPRMLKLLHSGTHLIIDRYAYSGVAYSAAKGLNALWCKQSDVGLPCPDVVLFLDLPIDFSTQRAGFGEERYEKRELQEKTRKMFLSLKEANWKIINANAAIEKVQQDIQAHVNKVIQDVEYSDIKQLWTNSGSHCC